MTCSHNNILHLYLPEEWKCADCTQQFVPKTEPTSPCPDSVKIPVESEDHERDSSRMGYGELPLNERINRNMKSIRDEEALEDKWPCCGLPKDPPLESKDGDALISRKHHVCDPSIPKNGCVDCSRIDCWKVRFNGGPCDREIYFPNERDTYTKSEIDEKLRDIEVWQGNMEIRTTPVKNGYPLYEEEREWREEVLNLFMEIITNTTNGIKFEGSKWIVGNLRKRFL